MSNLAFENKEHDKFLLLVEKMKSETLKYSVVNRKTLTGDEADLHELANLAGIVMNPNVFK